MSRIVGFVVDRVRHDVILIGTVDSQLPALEFESFVVARINFSHGKAKDHLKTIRLIRAISGRLKKPVAILGDLCGPKIRVGEFENGAVTLRDGSVVTITQKPVTGTATLIPSQYKNLVREVSPGDAVMMSAETASGKYPLEAFEAMDSILRETEAYQFFSQGGRFVTAPFENVNSLLDAVGRTTAQLSRDLMVHCILVFTTSGYTARVVSSERPAAPVMALTRSEAVARRMHLLWGVFPVVVGRGNRHPGLPCLRRTQGQVDGACEKGRLHHHDLGAQGHRVGGDGDHDAPGGLTQFKPKKCSSPQSTEDTEGRKNRVGKQAEPRP